MTDMRTLAALEGEHPCGPDLEYDPEFLEMEALVRGKKEQQFGDTLVAAEGPAWKSLLERCESLNLRTRDLRVLVNQTRSLVALQGMPGAANGFGLLRGVVEELWDNLHPKLDADDDNDPTMRLNSFAPLTGVFDGLPELRSATWITAKGIACTVRQALGCLTPGESNANDTAISQSELHSMVQEAAKADALNHARAALDTISALGNALNEQVGSHRAPDFRPITSLLKPLADFFDRATAGSVTSANDGSNPNSDLTSSPTGVGMPTGSIRSRNDAIDVLERVCQYLEMNEPSNPAPLLIRRAQRLLNMNFLDIVKDMAPEALANIENIAGTHHNNPSE